MPLTRTRKMALTSLAAVGVLAGSAGLANAVTSSSHGSSASTTVTRGNAEPGDHHESDATDTANFVSSLKVPSSVKTNAKSESAEDLALANLAKIDVGQAASAATKAVPGKVIGVELDDENGNLVYDVEVVSGKGTFEVTVDAGNSRVLAQQAEHDDETDHADNSDRADTSDRAETSDRADTSDRGARDKSGASSPTTQPTPSGGAPTTAGK